MKLNQLLIGGCLALAVVACGGDEDDTGTDAGTDTNMEDTTMEDTTMEDTTMEDTTMEDTTPDTEPDVEPDIVEDIVPDIEPDILPDVVEDVLPDVDPGPQPRGADNPPTFDAQIDRAGRAAISTALVDTFNGDAVTRNARKDLYNASGAGDWAQFTSDIQSGLAILDGLDTVCGNQLFADGADGTADRYTSLAGVLADDQLYVLTTSGVCGTYLGLEAEIVGAVEAGAGGCGGRTLTDDTIERSYSVLAAGILAGVNDGVTEDDATPLAGFPFLAAPAE